MAQTGLMPFPLPPSTPELLDQKLHDHRALSQLICVMLACVAPMLWIWDVVLDPVGAHATVLFRLAYLPLFLADALAFRYIRDRRLVAALNFAIVLSAEPMFLAIADRLQTGMTYGIGGFMYFFLAGMLLFQGFSLRLNLLYDVLAGLFPHLLALAGLAHHFEHAHYAVLIWPAAAMTAVSQYALAWNYQVRYESERRLERASNTDPLTGVHNRRSFDAQLPQEMARCRRYGHPLALLMLDIDHFKRVNDTFGHPSGDLVIRALADVCRREVRDMDRVARLGGEEFAILVPVTDLAGARVLAERVRAAVAALELASEHGEPMRTTVSIGVAQMTTSDAAPADLVGRADAALFRAKSGGRNRVECA